MRAGVKPRLWIYGGLASGTSTGEVNGFTGKLGEISRGSTSFRTLVSTMFIIAAQQGIKSAIELNSCQTKRELLKLKGSLEVVIEG